VEFFLTTKGTKKNKRHKKNVGRCNHKRNKEKQKAQKKIILGGGTTKKTKQSECVWVLNALARSVTKAPKLKKT